MLTNKALLGGIIGAVVAIIWVAFDSRAVLLVAGLEAAGWVIGLVLERPDAFISLLQKLQDR